MLKYCYDPYRTVSMCNRVICEHEISPLCNLGASDLSYTSGPAMLSGR